MSHCNKVQLLPGSLIVRYFLQQVPITWDFISCKASGLETKPVEFVFKSGSSAYYVRFHLLRLTDYRSIRS